MINCFVVFHRIGEYISLNLFYFVSLISSCLLIPLNDLSNGRNRTQIHPTGKQYLSFKLQKPVFFLQIILHGLFNGGNRNLIHLTGAHRLNYLYLFFSPSNKFQMVSQSNGRNRKPNDLIVSFNPFTAPAGEISGLKDAGTHAPANSTFSGPVAHLLSRLCVLIKILSHAGATKKAKRLKGFRFGTFIARFQATS